ncbi:CGNR zinc finger domain-containing protein [Streptomyces sp. RTGN2]|uniref:CGNR zinc finger domain-containing protein n=1 Tax=Streptomyces sp. RTGN2 TaxID=3016525 RepID=UPI002554FA78|nr:CGNR zinc finger domain-containing protein [Streptomyces sp. RTGN2]
MVMMIEAMPLETLAALVNEWGTAPRVADGRGGQAYPNCAGMAERLAGLMPVSAVLTERELAETADRLHPVFATPDLAERARLIAALLTDTAVRPTVRTVTDRLQPGWFVEASGNAVLASAAITLRQYLSDHSAERLGLCTGRRCADVYIDASPGGRRRFCSVTCQNRARVAAFRSRHTEETSRTTGSRTTRAPRTDGS